MHMRTRTIYLSDADALRDWLSALVEALEGVNDDTPLPADIAGRLEILAHDLHRLHGSVQDVLFALEDWLEAQG